MRVGRRRGGGSTGPSPHCCCCRSPHELLWHSPWVLGSRGLRSAVSSCVRSCRSQRAHNSPDFLHSQGCDWSPSHHLTLSTLKVSLDDPGGSDGKESACKAADLGLIPGSGRSPGEGNGYPLQHSCPENPMDSGAWRVGVHGITMSQTRLSN